ncbi:hypothetical protein M8J75_015435 [Diaphorina citri]|nr:hypothetical protein M8J75_015435 [Diaphorina citri]
MAPLPLGRRITPFLKSTRPFSSLPFLSGLDQSKQSLLGVPNVNQDVKRTLFGGSFELSDNGYMVKLNLKNFKPQDVSVKTKAHKIIVQSSLTKEKTDPKAEFERVARLFLRVYQIPADGDMKKTKADMTSDGVLIVQVPKMKLEPEPEEERCVAINLLPLSLTTKELFEKKKK